MTPVLAGVVALGASLFAGADVRRVHVEVSGDGSPRCVDEQAVHAAIADTLALPLLDEDGDTRVDIEISSAEMGLQAHVEVHTRAGRSEGRALRIERRDCAELTAAVALVAALSLDELWSEAHTLVVARRPPWALHIGVAGLVSAGDLPGVTGGIAGTFELATPRRLSIVAAVWAWPPRHAAGGRFSAYEAALSLCPRIHENRRLHALACAGVRVGAMRADGVGLTVVHSSVRARALADANVGLRVRLGGPVWLRFAIGVAIPFVRDRYSYGEREDRVLVHRSWPIVPVGQLAFEVRSELPRRRPKG